MVKKIVSYSGGKDSTAMLITLIEQDAQIDDILYVDVGNWMWEEAKEHNRQVEETLGVKITRLDVSDEIKKGFERWGFPSFMNRWCTGIKRDTMKDYIRHTIGEREREQIVQYIGYCADEVKRTGKKLYSAYDTEYPLVDAGITTNQALELCKSYGFDFGNIYEHHQHFNCWLCPLQKVKEIEYIFDNYPDKWDYLRQLQHQTDGYYHSGKTIFEFEQRFWNRNVDILKENRMKAREKYNKKKKKS